MPLEHRVLTPPDHPARWLIQAARSVTSQHGEDGIIEAIFEVLGSGSKWCIEFGAWDGYHLSNTWNLLNHKGWSGVQIEGNLVHAKTLAQRYADREDVFTFHRMIALSGPNSLDEILAQTPCPADPDLMVIDVDGLDWHIWRSLERYRPRVLVVEFNPSFPNDEVYVQDARPEVREGSSVAALVELGRKRGYELVAVMDPNAFFVRAEEALALGVTDRRLEVLRPTSPFLTRLVQFYDGRVALYGHTQQIWRGTPIEVRTGAVRPTVPPPRESAAP